ncbi:diguanylate cyclase [Sphingomonas sp.]|uniref:GGDEF domain-containing protein n=1 Tax=Sphingomonas sp. TaxID=28214 RepID=UPI003B3A3D32
MDEGVAVLTTLVLLSSMLAVALAVSTRSIGHTVHAQSWSRAFALAAAAWTLNIAHGLTGFGGSFSIAIVSGMAMIVPLLLWQGLSHRAGRPAPGRGWLVAALLLTAVILVAAIRHADGLWAALSQFFRAIVLGLALRHVAAPSRPARLDERMMRALLGLLAAISLVVGILALARQSGLDPRLGDLDRWLLLLALPPVFTGIGVAALTIIANDLAADLRLLASTDSLTGILNRRGFDQMSQGILAEVKRNRSDATFVLADIDRFKLINDRHGHEAGDQILIAFVRAIETELRQSDLFGRTGGEEFAILLVGATTDTAMHIVERFRSTVSQVSVNAAPGLRLTASFGVTAIDPSDGLAAAQRRADEALYEAKEGGRDRAVLAAT